MPLVRSQDELDKDGWRRLMRRRRAEVSPAEREAAGRLVAGHLAGSGWLRPGLTAAVYLSLPGELPTDELIATLRERQCHVAVPAWSPERRSYRFAAWDSGEELRAGPMRVPQPARPRWVPTAEIGLFLVPGLAFDRRGGRIGYGKGHYDRLLAERRRGARCVALGYDWQLAAELPQAADDIRMDWVVTPQGLFERKRDE